MSLHLDEIGKIVMNGSDYILVSHSEFNAFFEKNKGKEFVGYSKKDFVAQELQRYKIYHLIQEKVGRSKNILYIIEKILEKFR